MESIGAEVGQKMRSAIKAKLMELDCYVDEELPDYIMVMVANRRSKSQMTQDLNLFLSAKTATFVNWLHVVLKKLKEVTVTNPDVYKKAIKRKPTNEDLDDDKSGLKVKKEKNFKKVKKEEDKKVESLTDNLSIFANKIGENRKIVVEEPSKLDIVDDSFDIPLLSEVNDSVNEENLQAIEKKIRNVKSRLGLLMDSDNEDYTPENNLGESRQLTILNDEIAELATEAPKVPHKRITFEQRSDTPPPRRNRSPLARNSEKKKSVLSRLGRRYSTSPHRHNRDNKVSSRVEYALKRRSRSPPRDRETSQREGILRRLGVQSKVAVVKRAPEPKSDEEVEKVVPREVRSLIKVKPRVLPRGAVQPNKNLLLKAMAEAQKSIAQTPKVGKEVVSKPVSLFTKKKPSPERSRIEIIGKQSTRMRSVQKIISDDEYDSEGEYIPRPRKLPEKLPKYIPTEIVPDSPTENLEKQQFIITLDGIDRMRFKEATPELVEPIRGPSPIVFGAAEVSPRKKTVRSNIPGTLPSVRVPLGGKSKERCRFWPNCRQSATCEYAHPSEPCQTFPQCKFGQKCLFIHPKCKFGTSCTKRECPYDHNTSTNTANIQAPRGDTNGQCKYFPNCVNINCQFQHPKPCKYGKFCTNSECSFFHVKSKNLSWISK